MSVRMPTRKQLRAVARQCGLSLDESTLDSFRELLSGYVDAYNVIATIPDK